MHFRALLFRVLKILLSSVTRTCSRPCSVFAMHGISFRRKLGTGQDAGGYDVGSSTRH